MNDSQREGLLINLSAFTSARLRLVELRGMLADHRGESDRIEQTVRGEVASMVNANGVVIHSNQDKRDGAMRAVLDTHQRHLALKGMIAGLESDIAEATATVEVCKFTLETFAVYG